MGVVTYCFVYLRKKFWLEDVEYPLHNNKFRNGLFGIVGQF